MSTVLMKEPDAFVMCSIPVSSSANIGKHVGGSWREERLRAKGRMVVILAVLAGLGGEL
jgi:hypothetical protein